ncbi:MAG: dihydroorotate dehydrogenase [Deltaproteobacteria bacterium SG8_13]|nr:MAG: dihydroorotate dehydrogenase [Deltaproteobacteria bacterium SG8_13]
MDVRLVYMTADSRDEARSIGRALLESKLAACVNIIDNTNSLYMWDGTLQDDQEVIVIAKTNEQKLPALIDKVKALHSYECPCVLSIPVDSGNPEFLAWIRDETSG